MFISRPVRVLIADDNRSTAFTFGRILESRGYSTRVVLNGLAALDGLKEFRPDMVLLDIGMPGLNGCEVTRQIRTDPDFSAVPIVVISGRDQPDDKAEAIGAGANFYFVKPVDLDLLWATMARLSPAK